MENEARAIAADNWTADHNAYTTLASAIENNSIPGLQECLGLARGFFDDDEYAQFRDEAFQDILSHHSTDLLFYMLDNEGVPLTNVNPSSIFSWASKSLIDALTSRGWDVNTPSSPAFNGMRLLDFLVREQHGKEDLAYWLVQEKGATVTSGGSYLPGGGRAVQVPILETCAAYGTVSMFTFLEREGARPAPRMLHVAVEMAADEGVDPDYDLSQQPQGSHHRRVQMLHYLIDQRQLSVNSMDTDIYPDGIYLGNTFWGTPICYAARRKGGAQVVRWLLKKGADPTLKGTCTDMDAIDCAREAKCHGIVAILEDWRWERNEHKA
ncbi:hypothetical protein NPX13_g1413 [Xylaria arbuscula]|uniref:Ankyrin repeat protein n=1 Tax=Xylaria arbuscula TaxID=114810 RepID=A0A9W8NL43_9PEZI|nr:hypothetical protein NPX13_g1413 [Xylaria arbuscula]